MNLQQQLEHQRVPHDVAAACAQLFIDATEAWPYCHSSEAAGKWKEYFSLKYERYYYCNDSSGESGWDIPKQVQLREWMLDAALYRLPLADCRSAFAALLLVCDTHAHTPQRLWAGLRTVSTLLGNVVSCANSDPKFRRVRTTNARVRDTVWDLQHCRGLLFESGFRKEGSDLLLAATADLRQATLMQARVQSLLDRKGFTGDARAHDDTADSPSSSRYAGQPGFRYQREVHECGACGQPINDGSERLWTRRYDAPRGKFRYACEVCARFSLCEACWDRHTGGEAMHDAGHAFRACHPVESQHGACSQASDRNPWGVVLAGGSAARARERLRERTGM